MGNTSKYLSYKEAWGRIEKANHNDYPFEAVTLCESVISDRLLSYIHWKDKSSKFGIEESFYKLIQEWKRLGGASIPSVNGKSLADSVNAWRKERNVIVHGLTKSMPGVPTNPVGPFVVRAKKTAKEGGVLARAVSAWYEKEKRSAIKAARPVKVKAKPAKKKSVKKASASSKKFKRK